jgi:hypothetical protein
MHLNDLTGRARSFRKLRPETRFLDQLAVCAIAINGDSSDGSFCPIAIGIDSAAPVSHPEPDESTHGNNEQPIPHGSDFAFFCLAFFVRAAAAAFEAFRAMSLRSSGVIVFNRALPPFRPISARYLDTADASMSGT